VGVNNYAWVYKISLREREIVNVSIRNKNYFLLCFSIIFLCAACTKSKDSGPVQKTEIPKNVHQAHLSDAWYSQLPTKLSYRIHDDFTHAQEHFYVEADASRVKALVVPHAGHFYSGLCSASAYQTILATKNLNSEYLKNKKIKHVVILSPSHTMFLHNIALPDYTVYKTVFGEIETDHDALYTLSKSSLFKESGQAHAKEHAIEVQLPFLQKSIEEFKITPLVVGHLKDLETIDKICERLEKIIDDDTLIVVSSDFMHYGKNFDYDVFKTNIMDQIRFVDSLSIEAICKQSIRDFDRVLRDTGTTICGQNPIKILLRLLEKGVLGDLESRVSCYYTSAHIGRACKQGDLCVNKLFSDILDNETQGSVSYAGIVFTEQKLNTLEKENQLTGYEKRSLLSFARRTIANEFKKGPEKVEDHLLWPVITPGLQKAPGAFVTLNKKNGALRGCIGQISSYRPLYQTIFDMSKSAAFKDTRFSPLTQKELADTVVDISILTPPRPIETLHEIVLGKHGIILNKFAKDGTLTQSAVFLPQVPKSMGWDLEKTLQHLSLKAGLGMNGWKKDCKMQVFEGFEIHE